MLTPYYHPDPRSAAAREELLAHARALEEQAGPVELVVAGTGPARRDPLAWLADEVSIPVRTLHARFDPDRRPPQSRAAAINEAATAAVGEILLILHVDVRLPAGAMETVRRAVAEGYAAGAFPKRYDWTHPLLTAQTWWLNHWRLGLGRHTVGTNAVWLSRELWVPLTDQRLLEDVALSDRLRRVRGQGGLHLAPTPVLVSAARYRALGVPQCMAINAAVMLLARSGRSSPDALRDALYDRRGLEAGALRFWLWLASAAVRAARR